jgi:hypothetical protein
VTFVYRHHLFFGSVRRDALRVRCAANPLGK